MATWISIRTSPERLDGRAEQVEDVVVAAVAVERHHDRLLSPFASVHKVKTKTKAPPI